MDLAVTKTQFPQGRKSFGQSLVRRLWRRQFSAPLSEHGMSAAQYKLVKLAGLSKPLEAQTPEKCRKTFRTLDRFLSLDRLPVAEVENHRINVEGGSIGARSYRVAEALGSSSVPGLVYYHGGGCVIGDLETHDDFCRLIAVMTGIVVVSIDYRLAPEHHFPTQINDAIAGWNWALENAPELGIDPSRLGVGGDSAGGYLATSVCQQALDSTVSQKPQSVPCFQWLIYPWVDCRLISESTQRCTEGMLLTRSTMAYFIDHMLGQTNASDSEQARDATASPILKADLQSMPRTYVATAGFDPLESEGKAYAQRLRESEIDVIEDHFPESIHGFIGLAGVCSHAQRRNLQMIEKLKKLAS